ncbi:hypothetical protein NDU88_009945 [Pleurodeles waltl]|uniref:Uncharacterized protein n=1 Tax=Pleurodeles waltl TaxID=8319 RepID=A0AAV7RZ36_PLEWA|nr:hypothetical protein NDU88_009945 [Pleurodeles waltl]
MFAKPAWKKAERTKKEGHIVPDPTLEMDAPVTRQFLENLFTTLRDDIAALKQELAADVKDIRRNMGELEQRIDSLEWGSDNTDEELEDHKQEILALRDKTADLDYQLEDLENHLRRLGDPGLGQTSHPPGGIPIPASTGEVHLPGTEKKDQETTARERSRERAAILQQLQQRYSTSDLDND